METTIYADVLFFVNFCMDFITLWISSLLTSLPRSALKMSLASAIGGLYGIFSIVLGLSGPLTYVTAGAVSIIMALIAFGTCGGLWSLAKQSILIWGCGALLGGTMTAILSVGKVQSQVSAPSGGRASLMLAASVVFVYFTVRLICNFKGRKTVFINAVWQGRQVTFSALCDSGNLLRDPLSGDAVIPVSNEIIEDICGQGITEAIMSLDANALSKTNISLRIIPHRTDGASSLIGGFIPDSVTVTYEKKKKKIQCILAPRKCPKNYFGGNGATVPASIL